MTLIKWHNKYYTGIEEIDEQHKILLEYINQLSDALNNNQQTIADEIFTTLVAYTKFHLTTEEHYFYMLKSDDKALHKQQHQQILDQLNTLIKQSKTIGLTRDIYFNLIDWYVIHMENEDIKLCL